MFCKKCGSSIPDGGNFCIQCGAKPGPAECPNCHAPLGGNEAYCASCGARLKSPVPAGAASVPRAEKGVHKNTIIAICVGFVAVAAILVFIKLLFFPAPASNGASVPVLAPSSWKGPQASVTPTSSDNPQATAMPEPSKTQGANNAVNTAEQKIKKALGSNNSCMFSVSTDFSFENAKGVQTSGANGSLTDSSDLETKTAENILGYFLVNKTIRIENGAVSMDDPEYTCQMDPTDNGISIHITRGSTTSVNQGEMNGIISGNTLSGNIEVNCLTVVNHQSNGYVANGSFQVSLLEVEASQLPPKPPTNLDYTKNADGSITLTWKDPNPKGTVAYFEIICNYGVMTEFKTVAKVKNATKWTDTSDQAKTVYLDAIGYYIIAHGINGTKSEESDQVIVVIT